MKKSLIGAIAAVLAVTMLATVFSGTASAGGSKPTKNITEIVAASGGKFDHNRKDYDILLNAVLAAKLEGTLATPGLDVTVWAPNDAAFIRTARDLGFTGRGEAAAWSFLVAALTDIGGGDPIPTLTAILTYHVTPGARSAKSVLKTKTFPTLQGGTLTRMGISLVDADPDLTNPKLTRALDIRATNGVIHTIDRVLIPVNL